ncbi:MAG: class I SAM-dependent rRNA methyltransferase [Flavobacteriales bacterium]|nr:class I SAM-dependent rRNA methyltransferase [Flavobacteriales bacterium]
MKEKNNPSILPKSITLKAQKEKSIGRKHPWIFSGAIARAKNVQAGDLVQVFSSKNKFLANGMYQGGSIAVKILTFEDIPIDQSFFSKRIREAFDHRMSFSLISKNTNAYRLVHGESDGLAGLIIDLYNDTAVIQPHAAGYEPYFDDIAKALTEIDPISHVYLKSSDSNLSRFIGPKRNTTIEILENGKTFLVDLEEGQKTGFFLDQRENRSIIGNYASGKSVLNTCSYSGGFSIYALVEGAKKVHSVDVSQRAMALLEKNLKLNSFNGKHESIQMDVFKYLETTNLSDFDIVILDPPAFAKRRSAKHQAIKGYTRLNATAMKTMKKGSLLISFSCSQVVNREAFRGAITAAAFQEKRSIKIIQQLFQPFDHPVSLNYPEGEYLKGYILSID